MSASPPRPATCTSSTRTASRSRACHAALAGRGRRCERPIGGGRMLRVRPLRRRHSASAKPSWPFTPTVWIAVALTRFSRAMISRKLRTPFTFGSVLFVVDQRAVAHDVVGDDEAARARELQRPFEIGRVVRLVGVEEDEIERPLACRLRASAACRAPCRRECRRCRRSRRWRCSCRATSACLAIGLERDQPAVLRQRPRQPDGRVAAERADLEDSSARRSSWRAASEACRAAAKLRSPAARPSRSPSSAASSAGSGLTKRSAMKSSTSAQLFSATSLRSTSNCPRQSIPGATVGWMPVSGMTTRPRSAASLALQHRRPAYLAAGRAPPRCG